MIGEAAHVAGAGNKRSLEEKERWAEAKKNRVGEQKGDGPMSSENAGLVDPSRESR